MLQEDQELWWPKHVQQKSNYFKPFLNNWRDVWKKALQILPLIYKHRQGKLEGEFSSSSEVTWGYIPGTPSIILFI